MQNHVYIYIYIYIFINLYLTRKYPTYQGVYCGINKKDPLRRDISKKTKPKGGGGVDRSATDIGNRI